MRRSAQIMIASAIALALGAAVAVLCFESISNGDISVQTVKTQSENTNARSGVAGSDVAFQSKPPAEPIDQRREAPSIAALAESAVREPSQEWVLLASGRVVDSFGKPIAKASVSLDAAGQSLRTECKTDGDGRFEYRTTHRSDRGQLLVQASDRPMIVTDPMVLPVRDLELRCPEGGRICGSISLEHRCRLADLHVQFTWGRLPSGRPWNDEVSIEAGAFATRRIEAGYHDVSIVGNGFVLLHVPDVVVVDGQDTLDARLQDIHLEQLTRNVMFRVQDADGRPIENARFGRESPTDAASDGAGDETIYADDTELAAKQIAPGRYRLRVPIAGVDVPVHADGWRLRIESNVQSDRVVTLERAFALKFVLRSRSALDQREFWLTLVHDRAMPTQSEKHLRFGGDGTVRAFVDQPGEYSAILAEVGLDIPDDNPPSPAVSIRVQARTDEQVFEFDAP